MKIVTKRQLEKTEKALHEKIERVKTGASVRHGRHVAERENCPIENDLIHVDDSRENQHVPTIQETTRVGDDVIGQTQSQEFGVGGNGPGETRVRRVRRRKSVITRMNETIHRRRKHL